MEEKNEAVIIHMDESFVHKTHGSGYSHFFTNENGKVRGGFGCTKGKGSRIIMVHAMTKKGPSATRDNSGFPVEEGFGDEETTKILWQAKAVTGDNNATTQQLMAVCSRIGWNIVSTKYPGKRIIPLPNNTPYHHDFDTEVKLPESDIHTYNAERRKKI